jgi:hypothetical protein
MYRKFDVTENLLFAQWFFEEVNTANITITVQIDLEREQRQNTGQNSDALLTFLTDQNSAGPWVMVGGEKSLIRNLLHATARERLDCMERRGCLVGEKVWVRLR